jgi:lysophospholipid acyltransferase (LPLAT)-like uncharacterized protein
LTEARWISISAHLIESYLRSVARTIRTTFIVEGRVVDGMAESHLNPDPTITSILASQSLFLPFWNAHSMLLVSAYLSSPVRQAVKHFEAAADDSTGGRLTRNLLERIDLTGRTLSIVSPERRLEDLREILSAKPSLIMAADSYGPYRAISSGMARIARSYAGNVRPLSAVCSRSFPMFRQIHMRIPLPKSEIVVGIGPLLGKPTLNRPLSEVREGIASSLANLEAHLRKELRSRSLWCRD